MGFLAAFNTHLGCSTACGVAPVRGSEGRGRCLWLATVGKRPDRGVWACSGAAGAGGGQRGAVA